MTLIDYEYFSGTAGEVGDGFSVIEKMPAEGVRYGENETAMAHAQPESTA
ncbi:MAG: hypothetical protein V1758_07675 [Pseudomonadota bacterium]